MTASPAFELLKHYAVDEPASLVLDRDRLTVRLWLSFSVHVPAEAIAVFIGLAPVPLKIEKRGDVEKAHPGTCVMGLHCILPFIACLTAIRGDTVPLCLKVFDQPLLILSLGLAPSTAARETGKRWE